MSGDPDPSARRSRTRTSSVEAGELLESRAMQMRTHERLIDPESQSKTEAGDREGPSGPAVRVRAERNEARVARAARRFFKRLVTVLTELLAHRFPGAN